MMKLKSGGELNKKQFLIPILVTILLIILFSLGVFSNIQVKLVDSLYGGKTALKDIIIVAIDDKSLQEIGRWPWDRDITAKLFPRLKEAKVVGVDVGFYEIQDNEKDNILAREIKDAGNVVLVVEESDKGTLIPVSSIKEAAKGFGYANVLSDKDAVTRAIATKASKIYEPFSFAVARAINIEPYAPERFLINFVGEPKSFNYISASDVIKEKVKPEFFKNKIVFLGSTSPGLHDNYFVPTSEGVEMPGVEIHANALQTLIIKNYLSEISKLNTILIILGLAIITSVLCIIQLGLASIITLIIIIGLVFLAIYSFDYGFIMNIVYSELSVILTFMSHIGYFYFVERKQRKEISDAFSKYVSKVLVDELMKHPEKLRLGGERREITVLFSDIRGFTTVSEKLTPEQLVHLLNEYLTAMTDIIMKNMGLVDKYMGDAIMAFWNAPLDEPNHVELASVTCLEMIQELKKLQEKWAKENIPVLDIGVGLSTGEAVVGNMGSQKRFSYTAMGDIVNLGSRLEGLNKEYGTHVIISHHTYKHIMNKFLTRRLDFVKVKGKKVAIEIYELIGKDGNEKLKKFIKTYENSLEFYKKQKFDDAIKEFKKALSLKEDKACEVMIGRCNYFKLHKPENDWDGSWEMKTK